MRWIFREPGQSEAADRKKTEAAIRAWWKAFEENADDIAASFSRKKEFELPEWMHSTLGKIDPDLMWEYGPALKTKGHRLVITPEVARHLRPLTEEILSRAPKMKGWEFYAFRVPEDVEWANNNCEGRLNCKLDGVRASVSKGRNNRINVKYFFPDSFDDKLAGDAAFITSETLFGEEYLDKWIGAIEVTREKEKRSVTLERLQPSVHSLIDAMRDQLPEKPCHEVLETTQWSGLELKPEEQDEYAQRDDQIFVTTMYPEMWQASRQDSLFFSDRFSRHGETFCYLKIDGEGADPNERLERRVAFEDALNTELLKFNLGGHIGGGMGVKYGYVDLALMDVKKAIPKIRAIAQAQKLPKRAWLLFFDCYWVSEWVGLWPETPPPPVRIDENAE